MQEELESNSNPNPNRIKSLIDNPNIGSKTT